MHKKIITVTLFCFFCSVLILEANEPSKDETIETSAPVSIETRTFEVLSPDATRINIENTDVISISPLVEPGAPSGREKSILNTSGYRKKMSAVSSSRPKNALEAHRRGWKAKIVTGRPQKIENLVKEVPKELKARQEKKLAK